MEKLKGNKEKNQLGLESLLKECKYGRCWSNKVPKTTKRY